MTNPAIAALQARILKAAANGVNQTLDDVLADLVLNAPRKTGLLASRYRISDRATPEKLSGQVTNSASYSGEQYPYKLYSSKRYPNGYPSPSLFSPRTTRIGVLNPSEVDMQGVEDRLRANVEQAIGESLN